MGTTTGRSEDPDDEEADVFTVVAFTCVALVVDGTVVVVVILNEARDEAVEGGVMVPEVPEARNDVPRDDGVSPDVLDVGEDDGAKVAPVGGVEPLTALVDPVATAVGVSKDDIDEDAVDGGGEVPLIDEAVVPPLT